MDNETSLSSSSSAENSSASEHQTSGGCSNDLPEFREYMKGLPVEYIIAFSILSLLNLFTIALYIEELIHLFITSRLKTVDKHKTKWILAVYPILSTTGLVALLVPRSSNLNDLVAAIYVAICVHIFISMLIDCLGGSDKLLSTLQDKVIVWSIPPLCCCCFCCPRPRLSRTALHVLRSMIIQFALVRPFFGYLKAVIWSNSTAATQSASAERVFFSIGVVYMVSTLLAVWSFGMVYQLCKVPLRDIAIRPKFFSLQLVLLISGIQQPLFSVLVNTGLIPCDQQLTSDGLAARWNHMLLIIEMLLLNLLAKWFYRQKPLVEFIIKDSSSTADGRNNNV